MINLEKIKPEKCKGGGVRTMRLYSNYLILQMFSITFSSCPFLFNMIYWFDKEYKIFFLWTLLLLYYWFVNLFLLC